MSRLTLAQQLKQLEDDAPKSIDPESAYTSLDSLETSKPGTEGREHYLDVGPSRLRAQQDEVGQTLLSNKYAGQTRGRVKIFDDDEDDDEEDDGKMYSDGDSNEEEEAEDDEEDEDEDEDDGDESDTFNNEETSEEDEDDEDDEDDDREVKVVSERAGKTTSASSAQPTPRSLDPLGSLRESRQKDIEKGKGIRRQKALFDSLITLRITFQKALSASNSLLQLPSDLSEDIESRRSAALNGLADLNEKFLQLRSLVALPGTVLPALGKRKRGDSDYFEVAGRDSLALSDAQHPQLLSILHKWSSKINAATSALPSASSKFLQGNKGQTGVVEAIEAGIANRRESGKSFMESEEAGYRLLLKEVIESRAGGGGGADLSHMRREKKKRREAERGASKGRKIRYTVHEKAQNFVVPIPFLNGWHDEQMDELFSSLLGGAGMKGASAEAAVNAGGAIDTEGLADLGGLKVF